MTGLRRTASLAPAIYVVRIASACAIAGAWAAGLATQALASPCDPTTLAMTPQPQLSCPVPDVGPAPDVAPPPDVLPVVPGSDVTGPPLPDALPPPGEPPHIPPVVGEDGMPTQSYGQGGYLGQIWNEFHNGVPSEFVYGPPPADSAPPPNGPALPPATP